MSNQKLIHVKTVEGLMQTAMRQLEYLTAETMEQTETREDAIKALTELQETEIFALRRACEK